MASARTVATAAAKAAAQVAQAGFRSHHARSWKGDDSPVTELDEAAERVAIDIIQHAFPDHAILAEESGSSGSHEYEWVIDPIDGTRNFTYGIPLYASAVACLHRSQVIASAIVLPEFDEVYSAEAGGGATWNDAPLSLASPPPLAQALVGFTGKRGPLLERYHAIRTALRGKIGSHRALGSSATEFAYLAVSRLDVLIAHHPDSWDIAPGILIATEAGARAVRYDGTPWQPGHPDLILAHPNLVPQLLDAFEKPE